MDYLHEKHVYTKISRAEAQRREIKILQTKWVDVNKGDAINPNHRSRFVTMEFNTTKLVGLFASTPPLEALKLLVSDVATKDEVIMVNDIARAYFEAPISRTVAVELPDEDKSDGQDMVGLLQKSLYGTRDAAINFQREVQKFMRGHGFIVGRYKSTCCQ